jgi:hypothetical protein
MPHPGGPGNWSEYQLKFCPSGEKRKFDKPSTVDPCQSDPEHRFENCLARHARRPSSASLSRRRDLLHGKTFNAPSPLTLKPLVDKPAAAR